MLIDKNTFVSIVALANYFNLPNDYLKKLADKGLIPSLDVNGHRKFNPLAVEKALERLQNAEQHKRPTILGAGR
jgi:hypothetical protein